MTIAIGFHCVDGVVLCADSFESDGFTKKNVQKIWTYQVGQEWGIAVACAGEADLADTFTDDLKERIGNGDFDEQAILAMFRSAIGETRMSYPSSDLAMLVAVFTNTQLPNARLLRVMNGSLHLGPVNSHQSIGIASNLCHFFCSQLYRSTMFVEEAIRLGVFAVARAKEHVEGCGGYTSVVSHTSGQANWQIKLGHTTQEMEAEFDSKSLREAMNNYWKEHNPPSKWSRMTGGIDAPVNDGIPGAKVVISAKLETKPSTSQKSVDRQ